MSDARFEGMFNRKDRMRRKACNNNEKELGDVKELIARACSESTNNNWCRNLFTKLEKRTQMQTECTTEGKLSNRMK